MTNPAVLFPDAEGIVASELRDLLGAYIDDVTVGTVIPPDRPDWLVVVRRVGGARQNLVADAATLAVESWAPDEIAAHELAQTCRALVHALRGTATAGVAVYRVDELSGPQNLPDPLSGNPRYSFTVSVALRGTTLQEGS